VRINPNELHINDPHYHEYLYATLKLDKYPWFTTGHGVPDSILAAVSHDLHRMRRAAIAPFFTRTKVLQLIDVIWSKIEMLCESIGESKDTSVPVNLACAYRCLTADVVTEYCWGFSYDFLKQPKFNHDWFVHARGIAEVGHLVRMFPWIFPLVDALPHWFAVLISPMVASKAALLKVTSPLIFVFNFNYCILCTNAGNSI
jgi:hypothetical protein